MILDKKIKVIIPICDENLHVLPILMYMHSKYWIESRFEYHVIGFKEPQDLVFGWNKWFNQWRFHSLDSSQKGGSQSWSKYIANYLKTLDDECIIFALEDFIPTGYFNIDRVDEVLSWANRNGKKIGRFELGWDTMLSVDHEVIQDMVAYNIIEAKQNSMYRISTQTSLWNRKYLIKYMDRKWTPWQFEIDGSMMSTADYTHSIIGCADIEFKNFPAKWVHKGSISRLQPGKFNVLGMKLDDIKELCDKQLLKQDDLIMGQWQGYVPTFNELGGFNFDFEKFRNIQSIKQYTNHNWKEYENIYR